MRIAILALLLLPACAATVGTNSMTTLPADSAATCASKCREIGLPLDSVVIMASNVGCVCSATPRPGASAAAGGMAALLQEQEAASQHPQPPPAR
jgi:hypothetical protein